MNVIYSIFSRIKVTRERRIVHQINTPPASFNLPCNKKGPCVNGNQRYHSTEAFVVYIVYLISISNLPSGYTKIFSICSHAASSEAPSCSSIRASRSSSLISRFLQPLDANCPLQIHFLYLPLFFCLVVRIKYSPQVPQTIEGVIVRCQDLGQINIGQRRSTSEAARRNSGKCRHDSEDYEIY